MGLDASGTDGWDGTASAQDLRRKIHWGKKSITTNVDLRTREAKRAVNDPNGTGSVEPKNSTASFVQQ
jgi:hypothetical protein